MGEVQKIAATAARLTPAQWEIVGKFNLSSRRVPEHGGSAYHALIRKGVLEWSGFGTVRLSPVGLVMRWLRLRIGEGRD
jgi:hypothetical protein